MAYQVQVERNLCIGSGDCVNIAPNTFALDAENKSTVKNQGVDSDEILLQAAKTCPVSAILVTDANGRQIFP